MSRRRGEFEHRTSLFEGAYRAWSHLGGLNPDDLVSKSSDELDPLNMSSMSSAGSPTKTAETLLKKSDDETEKTNEAESTMETVNAEGRESDLRKDDDDEDAYGTNPNKRQWRYEPLPRSGLEHPFVRSIINPWLGADSEDPDEVEQGLATLRNWWQHRRKGESRSAVNALGTDKMRAIVDGYTRHFFKLALELVKKDKAHPPKSLLSKMGGPKAEKNRKYKPKRKKNHSQDETEVSEFMTSLAAARSGGTDDTRGRASFTAGLPVLAGLEGLSTGVDGSGSAGNALSSLKERNLSLLAGLGSTTGLPVDHTTATIDLLLQQQRQATLDPLELAQLARQRQLMAATSVLTPLEQLHLLQRERQLALLGSVLSTPLVTSSLTFPQSSAGVTNYSPPSWLLEPLARTSKDISSVDDEK